MLLAFLIHYHPSHVHAYQSSFNPPMHNAGTECLAKQHQWLRKERSQSPENASYLDCRGFKFYGWIMDLVLPSSAPELSNSLDRSWSQFFGASFPFENRFISEKKATLFISLSFVVCTMGCPRDTAVKLTPQSESGCCKQLEKSHPRLTYMSESTCIFKSYFVTE